MGLPVLTTSSRVLCYGFALCCALQQIATKSRWGRRDFRVYHNLLESWLTFSWK